MTATMWKRYPIKVTSMRTLDQFTEKCLIAGNDYEFPNVDNPKQYYLVNKDKSGRITLGQGTYGHVFEPVFMDDFAVDKRLYGIRKSINAYFFEEE